MKGAAAVVRQPGQQAEVGPPAHGDRGHGDTQTGAQIRGEVEIGAAAAAGFAVGQHDDVFARGVASLQLAFRFPERGQQQSAAGRLEPVDPRVEPVARLAHVVERGDDERCLVEPDHPEQVGIPEVARHGTGAQLGVRELALLAHTARLVDHQYDRGPPHLPLRRDHAHRQHPFDRGAGVAAESQAALSADHHQPAAVSDEGIHPAAERCRESGVGNVVQHQAVERLPRRQLARFAGDDGLRHVEPAGAQRFAEIAVVARRGAQQQDSCGGRNVYPGGRPVVVRYGVPICVGRRKSRPERHEPAVRDSERMGQQRGAGAQLGVVFPYYGVADADVESAVNRVRVGVFQRHGDFHLLPARVRQGRAQPAQRHVARCRPGRWDERIDAQAAPGQHRQQAGGVPSGFPAVAEQVRGSGLRHAPAECGFDVRFLGRYRHVHVS